MTTKAEPLKNKIVTTIDIIKNPCLINEKWIRNKELVCAIEWLDNIYFRLDCHFEAYYTDTKIKDLLKKYCKIYCCDFHDITQNDIDNFKRWLLKYKAFEDVIKK